MSTETSKNVVSIKTDESDVSTVTLHNEQLCLKSLMPLRLQFRPIKDHRIQR